MWRLHTARREPANYGAIHTAMSELWADLAAVPPSILTGARIAQSKLDKTIIKEWALASYQTVSDQDWLGLDVTGNSLPLQCAMAITVYTDAIPGVRQRRYNRCFVGPLNTTIAQGSPPELPQATQVALASIFKNFSDTLKGIPIHPSSALTSGGLAVVSGAAAASADATEVRVGKIVDTQRRRRNKLVESHEVVLL